VLMRVLSVVQLTAYLHVFFYAFTSLARDQVRSSLNRSLTPRQAAAPADAHGALVSPRVVPRSKRRRPRVVAVVLGEAGLLVAAPRSSPLACAGAPLGGR